MPLHKKMKTQNQREGNKDRITLNDANLSNEEEAYYLLPPDRVLEVKVDPSEPKLFVRLDNNKTMSDIGVATEEGSEKALLMEIGGARHFFEATEGITVPGKRDVEKNGFYHFYSEDIARALHWVSGSSSDLTIPKMENVKFPAQETLKVRSEYAVKETPITNSHVISVPISYLDGMIKDGHKKFTYRHDNLLHGRSCKFNFDFTKSISQIRYRKKYDYGAEFYLKLPKE